MPPLRDLLPHVTTLLCDADGNLFPSEEPAFAASTTVTNQFLERVGSPDRWDPDGLRQAALGRNFRALAGDLLAERALAMPDDEMESWVRREQEVVTQRLRDELEVDDRVRAPLARLAERWGLALVSSSALARLDVCLAATRLTHLFPAAVRYSAQDSLPSPTSKPDPAVYTAALAGLGLRAEEALAVEDAVSGVRSAVGAGIAVVGNLVFVPHDERAAQERALLEAGAVAVVPDWAALEALLTETAQVPA